MGGRVNQAQLFVIDEGVGPDAARNFLQQLIGAQVEDADGIVAAGGGEAAIAGDGDAVAAGQVADFGDDLVRRGVNHRNDTLARVASVEFRAVHEHVVD